MQFLMFVLADADADDHASESGDAPDLDTWWSAVHEKGRWLAGNRLRPPRDASTVRVRGGEVLVDQGPSLQGTEALLGFDLIEAPDLDEAIRIASRHPQAWSGRLELRPLWPLQEG